MIQYYSLIGLITERDREREREGEKRRCISFYLFIKDTNFWAKYWSFHSFFDALMLLYSEGGGCWEVKG